MADDNVGQLFSRTYIRPQQLSSDSTRLRRRLAAKYTSDFSRHCDNLASIIKAELGAVVPSGSYGYLWSSYFEQCELRDCLDTITLIYRLCTRSAPVSAKSWKEFVARCLAEEGISYKIDEGCGVRYAVDSEFEHAREATIALLDAPRHVGARQSVEASGKALDQANPNTLSAVRLCWDANENTFKQMFKGRVSRLGSSELNKELKPVLRSVYSGQALNAANLMADSFSAWVNAVHQYRHSPGEADPISPPIELAVTLISQGLGHLRWLLFLDATHNPPHPPSGGA